MRNFRQLIWTTQYVIVETLTMVADLRINRTYLKSKRSFIILCALCASLSVQAQEWVNVHSTYAGVPWTFPFHAQEGTSFIFSSDGESLKVHLIREDSTEMTVPYSLSVIDSISFSHALTDKEKGHNKYRLFTLAIHTEDGAAIEDKDTWVNCHFSLNGKGEYSNYAGTGRIRGRGNSSWLYYDKKPYKFKLDAKSKLLGMDKAKNWNLLSNYRDVTDMMNVYAFETAHWMGMPHTNHSRFVEVFLNGEYVGVYQLTEKVEIGKGRVDIDPKEGWLMSFDLDDGPSLSPGASDNFWSEVYSLPVCVKEPEEIEQQRLDSIKADFAQLERAVQEHDYAKVDSLMDIGTFISVLQLHEYLYNVEIDAPRSLYMFKDKGGKYIFGPVWDWDAAYCFDWKNWTVNHSYFGSYRNLIYGTDPCRGTGASYSINRFFLDMFGSKAFVERYQQAWANLSDSIFARNWEEVERYVHEMRKGAYQRDTDRWPLVKPDSWGVHYDVEEELQKMSTWLRKRKDYLDGVIASYPAEEKVVVGQPTVEYADGKVVVRLKVEYATGYVQSYRINLDPEKIEALLGGVPLALNPLNADGSVGRNTAAGQYGAWFDNRGDTNAWPSGHVYIEGNELYTWAFGCHPGNCSAGERHTVRMQYKRGSESVTVEVAFTIV